MASMASPVSPVSPGPTRGPRSRARRLTAVVLALGTVGALAAAAPSVAADAPHKADHGFVERDLVSDIAGRAEVQDQNLVNPWGLVNTPRGAIRVSNNGSNTSTVYSGARDGQPVNVLSPVAQLPDTADPTGVVRNDGSAFRFRAESGRTGPARYIFAGENGGLFAFNQNVDPTNAVQVAQEDDAVFKGLTLVECQKKDSKGADCGKGNERLPRILVANFRDARIDAFGPDFTRLNLPAGAFRDPRIPAGYAPFDIKKFGEVIFVTYAKQDDAKHDDVPGAGHGFINVFTTKGRLLGRFASRGVLNSPWGLETAPKGFGKFAGDLLVGNFGDGRINAFDPRNGRFEGTLRNRNGQPIVIDGLWGLQRGTALSGGRDSIWFSAGLNGEADGLLGTLRAAP
ncbi:TIGR03118 family protein [Streptomyces sasae]|uniref:TIGR03118 family protein n=1 Tax=Streptomyces sasae TaxID=1266772 RepID=UPI00292E3597|nr:TIGR03118 family protein [Streptomyces sasae]